MLVIAAVKKNTPNDDKSAKQIRNKNIIGHVKNTFDDSQ